MHPLFPLLLLCPLCPFVLCAPLDLSRRLCPLCRWCRLYQLNRMVQFCLLGQLCPWRLLRLFAIVL